MRDNVAALMTLATIVREGSISQAARQLGVSQPSLSEAVRKLEARLGIRLLERSRRGVSATEAGERLLKTIEPHLVGIGAGLDELRKDGGTALGKLRISLGDEAASEVVVPVVTGLLRRHSHLEIELAPATFLGDPSEGEFDAFVRRGQTLGHDVASIRITPDTSMVVVGSPTYLRTHGRPNEPEELLGHVCIAQRDDSGGETATWGFRKRDRILNVEVRSRLTVGSASLALGCAVDDFGLAYLPRPYAQPMLDDGHLVSVLDDWSAKLPGHFLHYPSTPRISPALTLLVDALRLDDQDATIECDRCVPRQF